MNNLEKTVTTVIKEEVEEEEVEVTENYLTQEDVFTDQDTMMTTLFTLVTSVSKQPK